MFSTLWDMFKAALVALTDTRAAINVLATSPNMAPVNVLETEVATIAAPAPENSAAGVDVAGHKTVNFYWWHSAETSSQVTIWGWSGARWYKVAKLTLDGETGVYDPLDLEGISRLAVSVEAAEIGAGDGSITLTLSVSPHNEG